MVKSLQETTPEQLIVKFDVPVFEFPSINTLSALVGADAPEAPPLVVDQFVVDEVLQVPVPPTQ